MPIQWKKKIIAFERFETAGVFDVNGDGQLEIVSGAGELVTGKRYRAHNGADPGEYDPVGIYYFKWNGESFSKQVIDYGPAGIGKGCGLHFAVGDLSGHGRLDVVAPGKDGLYFYENLGEPGRS